MPDANDHSTQGRVRFAAELGYRVQWSHEFVQDLVDEFDRLNAEVTRIDAARRWHMPIDRDPTGLWPPDCTICFDSAGQPVAWPCPTALALGAGHVEWPTGGEPS